MLAVGDGRSPSPQLLSLTTNSNPRSTVGSATHGLGAHQREQHVGCALAHFPSRGAHGGQRRQHLVAAAQIVEAGNRHALRHGNTIAQCGEQRALGEAVVAVEDGSSLPVVARPATSAWGRAASAIGYTPSMRTFSRPSAIQSNSRMPECARKSSGVGTWAENTATMRDGRRFDHLQPNRKGDPEEPLSDAELEDKFMELSSPVIGSAPARALLDRLWMLERSAAAPN